MPKITLAAKKNGKLRGKELEHLFWAYFNNKMTVLLMMIEHPEITRSILSVEKQKAFLNDLYHHFLRSNAGPKYHLAFKWLGRYLDQYPKAGYPEIYKAIQMVGLIYEAFGLALPARLEARRLEREGVNHRHAQLGA